MEYGSNKLGMEGGGEEEDAENARRTKKEEERKRKEDEEVDSTSMKIIWMTKTMSSMVAGQEVNCSESRKLLYYSGKS